MSIRSLLVAAVMGSALLACGAAQADTVYSAYDAFSVTNGNPNGVWTYTANGSLLPLPETTSSLDYWWSGGGVPDSILVGKPVGGAFSNGGTVVDPLGYLLMDPESFANVAVQFTAPSAGTYTITGDFIGDDTTGNTHGVQVSDSDSLSPLFTGSISTTADNDTFDLTETLSAGEAILFEVNSPGTSSGCSYCFLSTGLSATITDISAVPEPATWAMFLVGLGGIGVMLRNSRRKGAVATA